MDNYHVLMGIMELHPELKSYRAFELESAGPHQGGSHKSHKLGPKGC